MPANLRLYHPESLSPAQLQSSPIPSPGPDEILVHPHAWAFNPVDATLLKTHLPFVKYPLVPGHDLAGTVVSVGSDVTSVQRGDRVMGIAMGSIFGKPDHGGFQRYALLHGRRWARIPDALPFTHAAVLPLTLTTAAAALFMPSFLGLPWPGKEKRPGTLLVWGASSSVGCNAVQLARLAGYEVIGTCSRKNFEYMKSLGMTQVFDYADQGVVNEIVKVLDDTHCVGIVVATGNVGQACQVSHLSKQQLFVASACGLGKEGDIPDGVEAKWTASQDKELLDNYYNVVIPTSMKLVENALSTGNYKVAPEPMVVNQKGLEGIDEGYATFNKGVSAQKIVVANNEEVELDVLS